MQDTINVFPNPVDSVRVSAQDVTSEKVTNLLNWQESLHAFSQLVIIEYIIFVLACYYIIVTRVSVIKTNATWKRNVLMFSLAVIWGYIEFKFRDRPWLNVIATATLINFAWENLFKWLFRGLEKLGWTPLPEWHVQEIREEKQKDIKRVEDLKNNNP